MLGLAFGGRGVATEVVLALVELLGVAGASRRLVVAMLMHY
jgi:hypothetical protein